MKKKQLAEIRRHLEKTQSQMAQMLGVSTKAIQSFEQGWRNIPVHVERQVLLILALKSRAAKKNKPCWLTRQCPAEDRQNCRPGSMMLEIFAGSSMELSARAKPRAAGKRR
jgi:DNA-binding XRE family transcriptional regulator